MSGPVTCFLDLETFPNLVRVWRLYEANALETIEPSIVCAFSAKFLGGEHYTYVLPDVSKDLHNDEHLVKQLWSIVNQADILVAHNGRRFDFRRMNSRFLKWGLSPPNPTKKIDTCEVAKRVFGFEANSLQYLAQYLGLGSKTPHHGYELWQRCMAGDTEAWELMRQYNHNDVILLEKLYYKLRPWMSTHPNSAVWDGKCPKCGSHKLQSRGYSITSTRKYHRYQCQDCSGWCRDTKLFESVTITNA